MQLNKSTVISTLVFLLAISASVCAQSSNSAVLLLQPLGARGVALGESYVAVADGIHSQYWNPAGLAASSRGVQLTYTHRPELVKGVLNYEYGNIAYQINSRSAISVNFSYVAFKPASFQPEDRSSYATGVSYASKLTTNLFAGITVKRVSSKIEQLSAHAFVADIGLLYRIDNVLNTQTVQGQVHLGASLSNVGQKIEFFAGQGEPLPRFLRIGFAFDLNSKSRINTGLRRFGVLLSFEYQNLLNEQENENIWEWGAGAEFRIIEILSLRIGYHERLPKTKQTFIGKTLDTGMTYGAGLNIPIPPLTLQFDFASAPQNGWVERYEMFTFGVNWGS